MSCYVPYLKVVLESKKVNQILNLNPTLKSYLKNIKPSMLDAKTKSKKEIKQT
jgi:hypothetical protein